MFIGSERCISTTLRRSKRRLQARRDKRLGRIAEFSRLMTRAFKCSFSTTGNFEPIPLCSSRRERVQNGGKMAGAAYTGRKFAKSHEEGSAMSESKAVFVLIHGGWHNHSAWDRVTPILKAHGFEALTLYLPGAGANATGAAVLRPRPFDADSFVRARA